MAKKDWTVITAEDVRKEREEYFWERGFPYKAQSMGQLYNMVATAGEQSVCVVVVNVIDNYLTEYYIGYAANVMTAQDRVRMIKKARKYKVVDASVFQAVQ